jgi:hypothetical protein
LNLIVVGQLEPDRAAIPASELSDCGPLAVVSNSSGRNPQGGLFFFLGVADGTSSKERFCHSAPGAINILSSTERCHYATAQSSTLSHEPVTRNVGYLAFAYFGP